MGRELLAQNEFGGAPPDVHHQAALVGLREQAGDALVDQPRFFGAGDDVDGIAKHFAPA